MKRMILFTMAMCLSVMFFTGCKKETTLTQAEKSANELNAFIQKNGVKRVYPGETNASLALPFPANKGKRWNFSNGFIYIDYNSYDQGYNLNYLVRFELVGVPLDDGSSDKALILYFESL